MIIISRSVSQTKRLGRLIASQLMPGDIICLFGQLGAGKTVLAKGIAAGLGVDETEVISPSFVLMRPHRGKKLTMYHFDLYRLEALPHIAALGYEEYFYGAGVTVVEWAERLKGLLPGQYLKIEASLTKKDSERRFKISALGSRYKKLLEEIGEDLRH